MTPLCRKPNVSLHIRVSAMRLGYQSPKSVDSPYAIKSVAATIDRPRSCSDEWPSRRSRQIVDERSLQLSPLPYGPAHRRRPNLADPCRQDGDTIVHPCFIVLPETDGPSRHRSSGTHTSNHMSPIRASRRMPQPGLRSPSTCSNAYDLAVVGASKPSNPSRSVTTTTVTPALSEPAMGRRMSCARAWQSQEKQSHRSGSWWMQAPTSGYALP